MMQSPDPSQQPNGPFPRIPSESSLTKTNGHDPGKPNKPWERSQSALDLENKEQNLYKTASMEYQDGAMGGKVSEQSKVYWDLSKADEDMTQARHGKFKISLQTIHQKEEMKTSGSPSVSIQARLVRRMASETSLGSGGRDYTELMLPAPGSPTTELSSYPNTPSPTPSTCSSTSHACFSFTCSNQQQSRPSLTVLLASALPIMKDNITMLCAPSPSEQKQALDDMLHLIEQAWATPTVGRDLAYGLCDVLKDDGALDTLIHNCAYSTNQDIQLLSARVLEQSMTVTNRDMVAHKGLEVIVRLAKSAKDDLELSKATTGILESLFKHSPDTCARAIKYGGLDTILYSCRTSDKMTLRHCAVALANLAIYGGEENQYEMIMHKVPEWLFPLAFSDDDSIRYYAFLAITTLSANKEIAAKVAQSGTLELVEPFIRTHDPMEFAHSDRAHIHGQSSDWLRRLVPLLDSRRPEAQSLAAFHFAMEAGIKAEQGKREVIFSEIGAVEALKRVAACTNKLASRLAAQALKTIGEEVPHKLSPQVPLWTTVDVTHWLEQCGFSELLESFEECQVDGDLLLQFTEDNLKYDLQMANGITRKRFLRELRRLKVVADYQSCDPSGLDEWLSTASPDFRQYTYTMLATGADRSWLRWITDDHLLNDCGIQNGIHRMKILEAARRISSLDCASICLPDGPITEKTHDVFISYRRSNGSQLASLLKVHLQLRGFSVFLDIEKLRAGKFDDNLLDSVRNARNFILVLTPSSLERCFGDSDHKDWVHREVVAAIEGGCNIIPVMDNFQWPPPESLPEDMRPICYFNGIRWIHDYQDACVDKLEKFISGELNTRTPTGARPSLSKASSLNSATETHGPMFRMGLSADGSSPPGCHDIQAASGPFKGTDSGHTTHRSSSMENL